MANPSDIVTMIVIGYFLNLTIILSEAADIEWGLIPETDELFSMDHHVNLLVDEPVLTMILTLIPFGLPAAFIISMALGLVFFLGLGLVYVAKLLHGKLKTDNT